MTDNVLREWTVYGYDRDDQTYKHKPTGVSLIWEAPAPDGYEWEHFALVRREHGDGYQYAAYVEGGCSCNSPMDLHPDRYALQWFYTKQEPKAQLQRALRDSYFLSAHQKAEARSSLRNA